jgi:acyl-CoA hydrolase
MNVEYDLKDAVEILEEFNRAGIDYLICENGTFSFRSDNDRERAKKVIEKLKKKD